MRLGAIVLPILTGEVVYKGSNGYEGPTSKPEALGNWCRPCERQKCVDKKEEYKVVDYCDQHSMHYVVF